MTQTTNCVDTQMKEINYNKERRDDHWNFYNIIIYYYIIIIIIISIWEDLVVCVCV